MLGRLHEAVATFHRHGLFLYTWCAPWGCVGWVGQKGGRGQPALGRPPPAWATSRQGAHCASTQRPAALPHSYSPSFFGHFLPFSIL